MHIKDSLDKKLEDISYYINKNINSRFNFEENEENNEKEKDGNNFATDVIDVDYEKNDNFSYQESFNDFLDFNKYLMAFYSTYSVNFISKNNYQQIFKIGLNYDEKIQKCKKVSDE